MTTTDERILLRAILADPADDAPRLAYADEIWARDPDRAEFIKVQCDLADPRCRHEGSNGACPSDCYRCTRERLEFGLWKAGGHAWVARAIGIKLGKPYPGESGHRNYRSGETGRFTIHEVGEPDWPIFGRFHRGFLAGISLRTVRFLGDESHCHYCDGDGEVVDYEAMDRASWAATRAEFVDRCRHCRGTGAAAPGLAGPLFTTQPVAAVRLTDREPIALECDAGRVWNWMPATPEPESPHFVGPLWPAIDLPIATVGGEPMTAKYAPSPEAAHAALSAACVAHGRAAAKSVATR